jgi:GNAT superfamily N-acetyltransferase
LYKHLDRHDGVHLAGNYQSRFYRAEHGADIVRLLDEYASGPMGGMSPLGDYTRLYLTDKLASRQNAHALLAFQGKEPAGLAICFEGFSTFACRPLLNLHDFMVAQRFQGQGIAKRLLAAVDQLAVSLACCKVTLEVLEGNHVARALYKKIGYASYELNADTGAAMFWQKSLNPDSSAF